MKGRDWEIILITSPQQCKKTLYGPNWPKKEPLHFTFVDGEINMRWVKSSHRNHHDGIFTLSSKKGK